MAFQQASSYAVFFLLNEMPPSRMTIYGCFSKRTFLWLFLDLVIVWSCPTPSLHINRPLSKQQYFRRDPSALKTILVHHTFCKTFLCVDKMLQVRWSLSRWHVDTNLGLKTETQWSDCLGMRKYNIAPTRADLSSSTETGLEEPWLLSSLAEGITMVTLL